MNNNTLHRITQAIKNFDIEALSELLDDDKPYMDVSKSEFLKKLEKRFKAAIKDDCHSFDDVFFGICESCNKGCEGITFLSESGYYLDLFIESKDGQTVDDIYVCNKLTNFTDLEKTMSLGFSFCEDEKLAFKPSTDYTIIKQKYNLLKSEVSEIKSNIHLDKLVYWYDGFSSLRNAIDQLGPFVCFDYKLYSNVMSLKNEIDRVINIRLKASQASEALIGYHLAKSEREKLIWFYENEKNHYGAVYFKFPKNWNSNSNVIYKGDNIKLDLDISGFEYVMDYFLKLDGLYDELMEKYKPLPIHFEQSETGSVIYSLESYLKLHNKYSDVTEKYRSQK